MAMPMMGSIFLVRLNIFCMFTWVCFIGWVFLFFVLLFV